MSINLGARGDLPVDAGSAPGPHRRPGPPKPWIVAALAALLLSAGPAYLAGCGSQAPESTGRPVPQPSGPMSGPVSARRLVSSAERERYLGSAACMKCHPGLAKQMDSRHARTLTRVEPEVHGELFRRANKMNDPLDERSFHTEVRDRRCILVASDASKRHQAAADFAFGSGAVAYTYIGRQNGRSTELRLSHYVRGNRWDFTPGQRMGGKSDSPVGDVLSPAEEAACFLCHATVMVRGEGQLNLERSILGIGCETCHGPGKDHVAAVERGEKDIRMERLANRRDQLSMELCGECHRAPGDLDLNDAGMASQLPRLQSVALSFSDCFKKGKASCMSCHDPHRDAGATTAAQYRAKCVSCHSPAAPPQVPCRVQPRGDCVPCHMPAQDVGMPTSPRFRNHWIRVWPEGTSATHSKQ